MWIERASDSISIRTPAKVNLFLEVLGKRKDGYHEVETLLCPISLCDRVSFTSDLNPGISLVVDTPADSTSPRRADDIAWDVPVDQCNLVVRAATAVRAALGVSAGARIRLEKEVPAAAGLGGGSSDAAATVVAGLLAWGKWDRSLAERICRELGSDVAFFLGNADGFGLAVATGRGENCHFLTAKPALRFIVVHPPRGCSTAEIYARYSAQAAVTETRSRREISKIVAACESGQSLKIGMELANALQSAAVECNDWIGRVLKLLHEAGAAFPLMSGSGSSCFALLSTTEIEECIQRRGKEMGLERIYSVEATYESSIEQQLTRIVI